MSYLEKPEYTPVATERYIDLFIELLDQMPLLLTEIAPEGFESCIYHQIFYPGREQAYKRYNLMQMKVYLASGCKSRLKDGRIFLSKAEFLETYIAPELNLELEALAVYISAISDIFNTLSIVHDHLGNCFELHLTFADAIFIASHLTIAINSFYGIKELVPCYRYTKVDMQPIYRFIFRYLHGRGLDYQYISCRENFKAEWLEMSNPFSDLPIEAGVEASNRQISNVTIDDMAKISEYMNIDDMKQVMDLPTVVAAYLDVYGHWPEGYL